MGNVSGHRISNDESDKYIIKCSEVRFLLHSHHSCLRYLVHLMKHKIKSGCNFNISFVHQEQMITDSYINSTLYIDIIGIVEIA